MVEGVFLSGRVTGRCLWDWWPLVCLLGTLWLARSHRRASKWMMTGGGVWVCVWMCACAWICVRETDCVQEDEKNMTEKNEHKRKDSNELPRGCRNRTGRWWRKEAKPGNMRQQQREAQPLSRSLAQMPCFGWTHVDFIPIHIVYLHVGSREKKQCYGSNVHDF